MPNLTFLRFLLQMYIILLQVTITFLSALQLTLSFSRLDLQSQWFLSLETNCHHATWLGSKDMHGNSKSNDAGLSCFKVCQTTGLVNLVSGNTYLRNQGSAVSVLDLVLTDSPQIVNKFP